jgi:hypothetical protein
VGKAERKKQLGRPRRRWVDNIKMDLGEVGWDDVDLIGLAQDRNRWRALVNAVMNLRVPLNAGKLSSGYTTSGLSSSAQPIQLVWVFEDRALRGIFGCKREELTGSWGILHKEEVGVLYSSQSIIRVIKSWKTKLGRVGSMHGRDEKCK